MRPRGFTYIGLLLAVALAGVALAAAGTLWSTETQREREADLLFAGDQYRRAITAYYETVPAGQARRFPQTLEDLLQDKRWPTNRRHLRRLYVDPITGTREWGIVRGPGETITGVYSLSTAKPLKRANFPKDYQQFTDAKAYSEWRFLYTASGSAPAPGAAAAAAPGAPGSPASPGTPGPTGAPTGPGGAQPMAAPMGPGSASPMAAPTK